MTGPNPNLARMFMPPPPRLAAPGALAGELERRLEVVTLGPDDRLVVVFPADFSEDEAANAHEIIKARGWGERVLMLAGVEQLAVLRGEPS